MADYIFPQVTNPHEPKFDNECKDYEAYDENTLLTRFSNGLDRQCFMSSWIGRAVLAERCLQWDSLPTNLRDILHMKGWYGFANTPDGTVTMNRSLVREYYATLEQGFLFGRTPIMTHTLRGVEVVLNTDWINRHYGLPDVPYEEEFFSSVGSIDSLRPDNARPSLMYHLASAFGGTHLWPPNEMRSGGASRSFPGIYPADWLRVMLMFLANRVHGTIHHLPPTFSMYVLAYAVLCKQINVGKYIYERVGMISRGLHGDGYIHYPFLITALARYFNVPEYDTDDIVVETNPIVYEEHLWFD